MRSPAASSVGGMTPVRDKLNINTDNTSLMTPRSEIDRQQAAASRDELRKVCLCLSHQHRNNSISPFLSTTGPELPSCSQARLRHCHP
jgi:hypothetical protein